MGDRVWTAISFAGVIDEDKALELLDAANNDTLACEDGPEQEAPGELTIEHLKFSLYDEQANYGTLDLTEAACKELGVSYHKYWGHGGGFDSGMEIYYAVTGNIVQCSCIEGEPCLTLDQLKKMPDLTTAIDYLATFRDFHKLYGELEIKKVEVTS